MLTVPGATKYSTALSSGKLSNADQIQRVAAQSNGGALLAQDVDALRGEHPQRRFQRNRVRTVCCARHSGLLRHDRIRRLPPKWLTLINQIRLGTGESLKAPGITVSLLSRVIDCNLTPQLASLTRGIRRIRDGFPFGTLRQFDLQRSHYSRDKRHVPVRG
jgi:hypothetical protein